MDSRSRSVDSRDRKHHSHKKSKKRHRSRSPDSPYQSYSAPVEKHKKVRVRIWLGGVCLKGDGSVVLGSLRCMVLSSFFVVVALRVIVVLSIHTW